MTALEIFKELVKSYTTIFNMALNRPRDTIVKWEGVDFVEKELKALEIIKEKRVCTEILFVSQSVEVYNDMVDEPYKLNQEEYDLLKEIIQ